MFRKERFKSQLRGWIHYAHSDVARQMPNFGDFIQGDSKTFIMPAFSNSLPIFM